MNPSDRQLLFFSTLLQLEKQARHARNKKELLYIITNETIRLLNYRQAILWLPGFKGSPIIKVVSGVDTPDLNSPYMLYCQELLRYAHSVSNEHRLLDFNDLPTKLQDGWAEWSMGNILWCPLTSPTNKCLGGILLSRNDVWQESELDLCQRLFDTYAHALAALHGKQRSIIQLSSLPKRLMQIALILLVIFALDQPVRLSVLAPAEIVPSAPIIVTSPIASVIDQFYVQPNQHVIKGDPLFELDATETQNQLKVATKAMAVLEAEFKQEKQKAFADAASRARLVELQAVLAQKQAEIDYIKELLKRSKVYAEQDGITVFTNVNDWLGKPVSIGEKIILIADPAQVETQILLPVEDAINLQKGAEILVFLNIAPDNPINASLKEASYEATVSETGVLAFRIKADLAATDIIPRIGLRGTAKIYGKEVSLLYYLFRKPMIFTRQKLGL